MKLFLAAMHNYNLLKEKKKNLRDYVTSIERRSVRDPNWLPNYNPFKHDGFWNLSISPQSEGCWLIRCGMFFFIRSDGVITNPLIGLNAAIDRINTGRFVANQWKVPAKLTGMCVPSENY